MAEVTMPPRLPDDKRDAILADIKANKSRNQIARKHKVATSTVTRVAQQAGLSDSFDRSQTEKGTRAKVADAKERRASIAAALLDDIDKLRARAWSPYEHPMSSPAGPDVLHMSLPPLSETRSAYTAVGIAIDKHLALVKHDSGSGADQAKSMLSQLSAALGAAAEALEPSGGPAPGD